MKQQIKTDMFIPFDRGQVKDNKLIIVKTVLNSHRRGKCESSDL